MLADGEPINAMDNYIFVPSEDGGGKWVREDFFDRLPRDQYLKVLDLLEPYQNVGVDGIFSKWKERKAEKRAKREARKDMKAESKATARIQRTQGGGVLGKIIDGAKSIFGQTEVDAGFNIESGSAPTGFIRAEDRGTFFERNKTLIIVGGLVIAGGAVYLLTRKK